MRQIVKKNCFDAYDVYDAYDEYYSFFGTMYDEFSSCPFFLLCRQKNYGK